MNPNILAARLYLADPLTGSDQGDFESLSAVSKGRYLAMARAALFAVARPDPQQSRAESWLAAAAGNLHEVERRANAGSSTAEHLQVLIQSATAQATLARAYAAVDGAPIEHHP